LKRSLPYNAEGVVSLGDAWWALHLTTEASSMHAAQVLGKELLHSYKCASADGGFVLVFSKPTDERLIQTLRAEVNGSYLQTKGSIKGEWIPTTRVEKKKDQAEEPQEKKEVQFGPKTLIGQAVDPRDLELDLRSQAISGASTDAQEGADVGREERRANAPQKQEKKDPTKAREPKKESTPKRSPPPEVDNDDEDEDDRDDSAEGYMARVYCPDGEGPATKLHPAKTIIGRSIRGILSEKTQEVLEVVDDVGLSRQTQRALQVRLGDRVIESVFCNGHFWRYDCDSGVWIKITVEDMQRIISEMWWRHPHRRGKNVKALGLSVSKIRSTIEMMQIEMMRHTFFSDRRETRGGIAFRNGFATVIDGEVRLLERSPDHRAEFILPFDYAPDMPCPRWEKFLDEVMEPSDKHELSEQEKKQEIEAKKKMLGEYAGICLMGTATHYQKCLILEGKGGNGKSVITKVLLGLFAEDSISALAPQDWTNQFNAAMLVGKRLNIAAELPERDMVEGHVFKQIVAGDEVTVQNKFKDPFRAKMTAGHVFAANELPHSRDLSDGFWRRFLVLSLEQRFDNRTDVDTRLPDTLVEQESGGIAAWCLKHAARLEKQRGAFTLPTTSVKKKNEWQAASNPIQQFAEEVLKITKSPMAVTGGIKSSKLYEVYQEWTKKRGHGLMSSTKFGSKIKQFLETSAGRPLDKRTSDGIKFEVDVDPEWRYVLERDALRR